MAISKSNTLLLALVLVSVPARASLIEVDFSGTWGTVCHESMYPAETCNASAQLVHVGDSFDGYIIYDDSLPWGQPVVAAHWSMVPDSAIIYGVSQYPTREFNAEISGPGVIVANYPGSAGLSCSENSPWGSVEYILGLPSDEPDTAYLLCKEGGATYWSHAVTSQFQSTMTPIPSVLSLEVTAAPEPRDTFLCIIFIICGAAIFCAIRYGGWGRS